MPHWYHPRHTEILTPTLPCTDSHVCLAGIRHPVHVECIERVLLM